MRRWTSTGLALGLLAAVVAACLSMSCGWYWGCDADATCPPDLGDAGGERACPTDPLDGAVMESCGIWVSSSLGDDANPGTQERPLRTLAAGLALAGAGLHDGRGGRLYLCGEIYKEIVTLAPGVSLFGGFDCAHGWLYSGAGHRATVQAPEAIAALTLPSSDRESMIADVDVEASTPVTPGGSSIGVLALLGSKAVFMRSTITAGNGAHGLNGDDGGHGDAPAPHGAPGQDGMDACSAAAGLGGPGPVTHCGDGTQPTGGGGGDGNEVSTNNGLTGLPEPDPNPEGAGIGGEGQSDTEACMRGGDGAPGKNGGHGFGATGPGMITTGGYAGVAGGDGENGVPGQGGGGGGGSLGSALCGNAPHGGAGGGSGGAGGCGGAGGKGGQAGGSSFGVVLFSPDIRGDATVEIQAGNGGNGGRGSVGQQGGNGGVAGKGGLDASGVVTGCAGGAGGHGGYGGAGGGGHGGHAIAVVQVGFALPVPFSPHYGVAGVGGPGGSADSAAEHGADGTSAGASTFN